MPVRQPMTEQTLRELIRKGESKTLEFKDARIHPRSLAESFAAFAAADGGVVLVGVANDGTVQGISDFERVRDHLIYEAAGRNHCEPQLQPIDIERVETADGRTVVAVTVPADFETLHSVAGKYFLRVGSHNEPLTPRALRRLVLSRGEVSFERLACESAHFETIDMALVEQFMQRRRQSGRSLDISHETLLVNLGCLVKREHESTPTQYVPTQAGVLLFSREPQSFLLQSEVLCVRFNGTEVIEYLDRKDLHGPLPQMVEAVESFIRQHTRVGGRIIGFRRVELPEYPIEAVREIILNAMVHRDWSLVGQHIRVFLFDNRIEIHSPGRLMPGVSVEQLRQGESHSVLRNPVIVEVFKDLGYIEKLGSGIPRVFRLLEEHGLQPPVFAESSAEFTVTVYGPGSEFMEAGAEELLAVLNPRQRSLQEYFRSHDRLTMREYRALHPEISERTARYDIEDLVAKDILVKHGQRRGSYYTLREVVEKEPAG